MQLDKVSIVDWGFEGVKTPKWAQLNPNIEAGLFFKLNPAYEDAGSYSIYVNLVDDNSPPLSSKYEFELLVIDTRFKFF